MATIAIDARIINSSTGRYVERLLHYLQKVDTKNTYIVLVRAKDETYWKPVSKNFSVRVAEFDNYSFAEQLGFKKYLNELGADLVHFCMPQQPLLYKGKKVTTFHDLTLLNTYNSDKNWLIFHSKQLIGRFAFKSIARSNTHIITPSIFTKKALQSLVSLPDEKISVIYEAGETQSGKTKAYTLPFKEYILYVGQQSDYKNIKRLGDAHQKLIEQHPHLGLVLVGKKNAGIRENEAYFQSRDYKNIFFTDFVSDEELNWLYDHATAYIFPSLMEGFGLPGLEAMSRGLPVISSNATCLPEVYGDAAVYFDPLDTKDIARTIHTVISNEKTLLSMKREGLKQVKKYSWQKMAEETFVVYDTILKSLPEQS